MPSLSDLLSQLETSKREFGAVKERLTERLLLSLAKGRFSEAESLTRFHEALLFIRSHPQSPKTFRLAEKLLSTFAERVDELRSSGADLTALDYIEYSGIAGTTIKGWFSYDIVRFLVDRYGGSVDVDWPSYKKPERLARALPRFLPLLYEDALVEANIPYLSWLHEATGNKRDLEWIIRRFEDLDLSERNKSELYDSLELRVRWDLGKSRASRTLNKLSPPRIFYQTEPLIRRSEVNLDEEFASPPLELKKLSRAEGKAMQDMLRDTTTVRYRELYGITHGDPGSVVCAEVGRGVEIFLWGLPPERRLPLRAYHAGFTLKNGVPINYIEGITICERMEVGFNTFYTFREGESAWVYAKVLKLLHQLVGVTCISIDSYQLGLGNDEAIESGAFWFYRKLGFRPTRPELATLMRKEEAKLVATPGYRTPARVLRRLAKSNVVYEAPGSRGGDWDRFAIRNVGLAVQRRMTSEFAGDARKMRAAASSRVASTLEFNRKSLTEEERRAFDDLALVVDLIPDLRHWTRGEKRMAKKVIRAKLKGSDSTYARLLQRHAKLREAIIRLGQPDSN